MTKQSMTVDEAFNALTQLITYSNKLAQHTQAEAALDTLRAALTERDATIDHLRAALERKE